MKVCLIDSRQGGDWSLDLLYAGLVKNLGAENVIDYPAHDKHRIRKIEFNGDPEHDWGAERMSLSYVYSQPAAPVSRQKLTQMMKDRQIDVIFVDEREESFKLYLSTMAHVFDIPVVVVAGHDRFWNSGFHVLKQKYYYDDLLAVYADNWRQEHDEHGFRLYNWSVNFDHFWDSSKRQELLSQKKYDIAFVGYSSDPSRTEVIDHVLQRYGTRSNFIVLERRPNSFDLFLKKKEYFEILAQSKVCLNIRGAAESGKTLRFYEIPYVGSFMLSQTMPWKQLHPFVDGQHCGYFDSINELDRSLELYLGDERLRESIAAAGYKHMMENHTVERRVGSMLEEIRGDLWTRKNFTKR